MTHWRLEARYMESMRDHHKREATKKRSFQNAAARLIEPDNPTPSPTAQAARARWEYFRREAETHEAQAAQFENSLAALLAKMEQR